MPSRTTAEGGNAAAMVGFHFCGSRCDARARHPARVRRRRRRLIDGLPVLYRNRELLAKPASFMRGSSNNANVIQEIRIVKMSVVAKTDRFISSPLCTMKSAGTMDARRMPTKKMQIQELTYRLYDISPINFTNGRLQNLGIISPG
jgi:hypothetical protein